MKALILVLLFFSSTSFADYRTMPVLDKEQLQTKLDLVNYAANYTFETKTIEKKRYGFAKLYHMKGELHYSEYLHDLNGSLKVDVYAPRDIKGKKLPVIIIFPPIGGVSKLDKITAKYYAKKGFIAVISHLAEDILGQVSLDSTMSGFVRTVIRNRILLDYISEHPNVDPNKIGVYGVSLGGIRASLFYSIDLRVKAASTVVGGVNLPGIMAYSKQEKVANLRKRFMANHNLDDPYDYESLMREKYYIDGSNYSAQVDPNLFYMVVGEKDEKVPTRYQEEMFHTYKEPHIDSFRSNHTWTIILMFLRKRYVASFFNDAFGMPKSMGLMMSEEEEDEIDPKELEEIIEEVEANL